jgi:formylglycine-generating enzyme required for sulfatase activity
MGKNPSQFNPKTNDNVNCNTEAELPVDSINWEDCKEFFNKLEKQIPGLQLTFPTEAQWEYACRAGTQTPFNTGNNLSTDQANYNGNYPYNNNSKGVFLEKTVPVTQFQPNPWGLYQMHGNLWEWCLDVLREYPQKVEKVLEDPMGSTEKPRAELRGGSWIDSARVCCSANRAVYEHDLSGHDFGLRPCSTIDLQEQSETAGEPV